MKRVCHPAKEPVLVILSNSGFRVHPELNTLDVRALFEQYRQSLGRIVELIRVREPLHQVPSIIVRVELPHAENELDTPLAGQLRNHPERCQILRPIL